MVHEWIIGNYFNCLLGLLLIVHIFTVRMPNGLYKFRDDSNSERVILDCVTSLQNGADLLWIETAVPNLKQISSLVNAIRTEVKSFFSSNTFTCTHLKVVKHGIFCCGPVKYFRIKRIF